ncbi:MAG: hypothetical protein ACUVQ1_05470 [Candidatus Kapaibacteriales bacterium]
MTKNLTYIFILLLPCLLFANESEIQNSYLSIGIESLVVSSINSISVPERKNYFTLSPIPDFSLTFESFLTKDRRHIFKALFSYGEISEKFELTNPIHTSDLLSKEPKYELSIFYLGVQLAYEFYHIGLGFGLKYPISGKSEYSIKKKDLSSIFDFHIAYYLSIFEREKIEIQLVSKINFALSGQFRNYPASDPFTEFEHSYRSPLTKQHNPHPITFGLGFLFKYNI